MDFENLQDLRVLLATARRGSLTGAAQELGVTPAAASAMLKRLEARLGARLFERSTRALRLTPQGALLLGYAQRALDLLAEGEAQMADDRGALAGLLRLTAPSDLARSVLLPWLDAFLAEHPRLRLDLAVSDRVQDVVRDDVDLALRYGQPADSRLVARPLQATTRVACAAPAYLDRHPAPQVPDDLADHNCLLFQVAGRTHRQWRFLRDGRWTSVRVAGNRATDDAAIAHQWAVAGAGIVYKAALDVMPDIRAGRLVPLLGDWEGEPYVLHAVMPSNRFVPARVRALVDFLARRFEVAGQP